MTSIHETAPPAGEPILQVVALPRHTNDFGDIPGGWVLAQMELAGAVLARRIARGRVATVAVGGMGFMRPIPLGALVRFHAELLETGRTSLQVGVEVWIDHEGLAEPAKVSEGHFWYVALGADGRTRPLPDS
ncbi:MAG: acyl-CoA thioesterase [Porticoccaceae bacterium]|nr:MAG: acyl-CoA thioesterase [Porticoccaceae bacterium]